MNIRSQQPDWDQVRAFVSVAETGSLSAAGRHLGLSQPTVGRHIRSLETALGVRLFQRGPRGLVLSEAGAALLEPGRAMAEAAGRFALAAQGRAETVAGTVRITASMFVATFVLPEIVAGLRVRYPEIELEIVASDATDNLLQREADIAVRMYRPEQPDVITRHVADLGIGMFAATAYLARRGRPCAMEDLLDHDVIGYDRADLILRGFAAAGYPVDRHFFAVRCDDQVAYWHYVVAGAGIGFSQTAIGEAEPRVERVLPDMPLPTMTVWLTAHEELRTNPRVRRVFDALAEGLARIGP